MRSRTQLQQPGRTGRDTTSMARRQTESLEVCEVLLVAASRKSHTARLPSGTDRAIPTKELENQQRTKIPNQLGRLQEHAAPTAGTSFS